MVSLRLLLLCLVPGPAVGKAGSQEGKTDMKWVRARTNRTLRGLAGTLPNRLEPTPVPPASSFQPPSEKDLHELKHLCQG